MDTVRNLSDDSQDSIAVEHSTKRGSSNEMNRRDFLKAAGLGAVSVSLPTSLLAVEEQKDHILSQADTLIEKYRKGDVTLRLVGPDGKPLKTALTVRIEQRRHKFLFGCNIFKFGRCKTREDNAAYEKQFAALLNFATLPFYWWNYEQQRGRPDDDRTEEIINWCKRQNITTKGHPLAWNYAQPRWLSKDPEAAMKLQMNRIERCTRRFKDKIDIWDVVNEATHYDRPRCKEYAPTLTEAISKMGIGSYVRESFKRARNGNPKAILLINDYRTDPSYAEKVISKLLDDSGQPLYDVVGIQSHMHSGYWDVQKAWEVCERFAKFGKPLHFTETTLVSGMQGWELRKKRKDPNFVWATTSEGEQRQAKQVAEFYRILFSHPAVEAITWWDFTDQQAWQRAPAGLVRADMTPKPAYEELERLIKGKWWTQTRTTIADGGKARFRGFFGQYEVSVRVGGRKVTGKFRFDKTAKEIIEVRLKT
ncbi:MAG: endo-1,4-beta-xylanase [Planctomycetota bacterium]|jgi:GH35 family endo-1,4-beta-xylanase